MNQSSIINENQNNNKPSTPENQLMSQIAFESYGARTKYRSLLSWTPKSNEFNYNICTCSNNNIQLLDIYLCAAVR